jgi:hypothetical protein
MLSRLSVRIEPHGMTLVYFILNKNNALMRRLTSMRDVQPGSRRGCPDDLHRAVSRRMMPRDSSAHL